MALNNIIKEPRREFTETGVGIGLTVLGFIVLYWPSSAVAQWFCAQVRDDAGWVFWSTALTMMIVIGLLAWAALAIVHNFGERFCNNLAARGTEIRGPRVAQRGW